MWKTAPSKVQGFWVISHSNNKAFRSEVFLSHLKAHTFVQQGCFFFHYSLTTLMTNGVKMFTDLICWVHQVRTLFFDDYQMWPVPLILHFINVHFIPQCVQCVAEWACTKYTTLKSRKNLWNCIFNLTQKIFIEFPSGTNSTKPVEIHLKLINTEK